MITTFILNSPVTNAAAPFTIGHAFKKGHIPAGKQVVADIADFQCVPKNYWDDGSLKIAVLSGKASLTAGVDKIITLSIGVPAAGTALTITDLKATSATATITAGAFGSAAWATTGWDTPFKTWISGPKMSSWIYRKQVGTDTHLVAWLEVRLYSGGAVEILPFVENGYLKVAAPINKVEVITFVMNGTERFNLTLDIKAHARTVLINGTYLSHWSITDPQVFPRHDKEYAFSTKLIPTYYHDTPVGASTVTGLPTTFVPFQRGNWQAAMGSGGFQADIGIIPNHDALYFTCGDKKTYQGVIRNAFGAGRYRIHYRDETTNRPLKFSQYPNLVLTASGGGTGNPGTSSTNDRTPAESGGTTAAWSISHHPSIAYTAYLISGWHYFIEEMQFAVTLQFLMQVDGGRGYTKYLIKPNAGANQTRGAAWGLRTLAQASVVTPDDDVLAVEFRNAIKENIDYSHAKYLGQPNNAYGFVHPYTNYGAAGEGLRASSFQTDFFTAAIGFMKAVEPTLDLPTQAKLTEFFAWKAKSIIGRLGGTGPGEFLYRDAADYEFPLGPNLLTATDFETGTGPFYSGFGESWDKLYPTGVREEGDLRGGNFPIPGSYWANLNPAISYAVEHKVPGAVEAYNRLVGASNWHLQDAAYVNYPVYGIAPSSIALAKPTGEKVRVDFEDPVPGRCIVGFRGLGVLAQNIPAVGTDGPGLNYDGIYFPADLDKEVRLELVSPPAGDLVVDDNYGATYQGPASTMSFKVYEDGALKGTSMMTFNMGASTVPAPPTIGTAVVGDGVVYVYFNLPSSDGGSPITFYTVVSSAGNVVTGTVSPISVAVPVNTPVSFTVTASNKNGASNPSASSNTVTLVPATNVPGAPRSVIATPGDGKVVVTFAGPLSDGGAPIILYTATTSTGLTASAAVSPIEIPCPNDVAVSVTVVAINSVGPGVTSAPSNTVTPVAPPPDGSDMQTYYFDFSRAANGVGSLADPFNTLTGMPVGASNTYKMKRGTSWAGVFPPIAAGTAQYKTTFTSYFNVDGTDDVLQPLPFLNLGDSALPGGVDDVCFDKLSIKCVRLVAANDVGIWNNGNGVTFTDCFLDTNLTGLFFYNNSRVLISGNTIRTATMATTANAVMGVVFTGEAQMAGNVVENNFLLTGDAGNGSSHVIRAEGYNGGKQIGLRISGNYIRTISGAMTTVETKIGIFANNCDDAVIAGNDVSHMLSGVFCNAATRVKISANRLNYNGNFGVHVTTNTSYFEIEDNECSYNGSATGMNFWGRGIELSGAGVQNSCTQHIVRGNTCAYNMNYGGPVDNGTEGVGIGLDDATSFCQVHNNTLYRNDGNGIQAYGGDAPPSETGGNTISNNIFFENGLVSFWGRRTGGDNFTPGAVQLGFSGTHGTTTLVAHNIFVGGVGGSREDADCTNILKFSNTFVDQTMYCIASTLAYGTDSNRYHIDVPIQIGSLALDADNSPAPVLLSAGSATDQIVSYV